MCATQPVTVKQISNALDHLVTKAHGSSWFPRAACGKMLPAIQAMKVKASKYPPGGTSIHSAGNIEREEFSDSGTYYRIDLGACRSNRIDGSENSR